MASRKANARYLRSVVLDLLTATIEGLPVSLAAGLAGVTPVAVYGWLDKNGEAFREKFAAAFHKAKAIAARRALEKINASGDWKAAAYWLDRNVAEYAEAGKASIAVNNTNVNVNGGLVVDDAAYDALQRLVAEQGTKGGDDE